MGQTQERFDCFVRLKDKAKKTSRTEAFPRPPIHSQAVDPALTIYSTLICFSLHS